MPDYRIVKHRKRLSLAYRDDRGKRVRIALGTDDPGIAEARARDIWRARSQPASERVADLWTAYVADRKQAVARKDRFDSLWAALKPHFGHRLGTAVTADDCREYAKARKRDGMAPSTIKTELEFLRACLNNRLGNRAPKLWVPTGSKPRERFLTTEQAKRLLDCIDAPHVKLFVTLALTTGARMSAILDLTWDRVSFDGPGHIDFNPAGRDITNKRRVGVPMNERCRKALEEAKAGALTDHVIEYAEQPVASVKKAIRSAARRSGIACSPHVFRHTCAVWMAQADIPMQKIAQYLGHTTTRVTEQTYARYSPSYMRDAAAAVDF